MKRGIGKLKRRRNAKKILYTLLKFIDNDCAGGPRELILDLQDQRPNFVMHIVIVDVAIVGRAVSSPHPKDQL